MVAPEMAEHSPSPPQEAPSPQCVGREFVRQYYTLLAEGPQFVHRFYSNESIFVHGTDEETVGQQNIEKKIAALNFHDCRTRIRVLDSHETIGKGVVVLVVGEIAVNGDQGAMRRFVQTFVLAPQSEKKYYVYNDIFRYEDDLFKETEGKERDGEIDCTTVPDPTMARPQEQRPPRAISNGGTHVDNFEKLYPMMPQQQGLSQTQQVVPGYIQSEQQDSIQRSPLSHPSAFGAQPPLPQRNASGSQVPLSETSKTYGPVDTSRAWSGNAGPTQCAPSMIYTAPTASTADAHPPQHAQSSQQQQTTPPSFTTTMPSQPPVISSSTGPQITAQTQAPAISEQARPLSEGKESPIPTDEQEQQRETTTGGEAELSWANRVKKDKTPKGSQQQQPIPPTGQPPMVSPGQNVPPPRPPTDLVTTGGHGQRFAPPSANFPPPDMGPRPIAPHWDVPQQHPPPFPQQRPQYRQTYLDYGQSQDARASPAPSGGGGGGGRGREIPIDEGVYLKNVPVGTTDEDLRNALQSLGAVVTDVRLVKKEVGWFAFVNVNSADMAKHLTTEVRSLNIRDEVVLIQQLRRPDQQSFPNRPPGTGQGYQPGMQIRGGRGGGGGGRGNLAQRGGGDRGRGSRGGGPGPGSRTFSNRGYH